MTSLLPLLVFAFLGFSTTVGYKRGRGHASGGVRARYREATWHAGIYTKTTSPYMQICGGTVVSTNAVLTAAHCFTKDRTVPPASDYAVAGGKIYRPWENSMDYGVQRTDVAEIKIPPRYQGSVANYQHDIAVVLLLSPFIYDRFVVKACVNFDPDFDDKHLLHEELGTFVGWGETGPNTGSSQVLQKVNLPNVLIEKCIDESPPSFRSAITGDKICAGYKNGTALCHGDSGGGLVFSGAVNNKSRWFLRGVASTSPPDENSCNINTWATFTHILSHERFIKTYIADVEDGCVNVIKEENEEEKEEYDDDDDDDDVEEEVTTTSSSSTEAEVTSSSSTEAQVTSSSSTEAEVTSSSPPSTKPKKILSRNLPVEAPPPDNITQICTTFVSIFLESIEALTRAYKLENAKKKNVGMLYW